MKLLFFDDFKLGVLKGDNVVDVSQALRDIPHTGPHNLISGLIERFADYRTALEKVVADGKGVPMRKEAWLISAADVAIRDCIKAGPPECNRAQHDRFGHRIELR